MKSEIQIEEAQLLEKQRLGEIDDTRDPEARSSRHRELLEAFDGLVERQSDLVIKEDFSRVYTGQGASGMNAGTSNDFTIYFVNVPANKLELWFWMESDRLLNPVFREFYSERDVVHEERRLRTDSTPIGKFQEQFDAMFWESSPYSWPVVGWPSDLEGITREEALAFFDVYYAPSNIAAALVGDFDTDQAIALAERYFGRLIPNDRPALPPRTREMPQLAEKRMVAYAETNPQVVVRYHTVPDGHVDEPALVKALQNELIGGAGLDVFETEPLPIDSPLRDLGDNVLLSPHMSSHNFGAGLTPGITWGTADILHALRGEDPEHVYNPEALPQWRERFAGRSLI